MLKLTTGLAGALTALNVYDLGFLRERYCDEHAQFADRFEEAAGEAKKFLALPLFETGPLAFICPPIDRVWHTLIQHTPQYTEFCNDVYGQYLQHQPNSEQFPVAPEATDTMYLKFPKYWGPMGDIWFEGISMSYVAAMRSGRVPSEVRQLKWSGWPGWS